MLRRPFGFPDGGPPNPPLLEGIDYIESENTLRDALHGTGAAFGGNYHKQKTRERANSDAIFPPQPNDPKLEETAKLVAEMDQHKALKFLDGTSPHLSSFVRARALQTLRDRSMSVEDSVQASLEGACTAGLPSLREVALKFPPPTRSGGCK